MEGMGRRRCVVAVGDDFVNSGLRGYRSDPEERHVALGMGEMRAVPAESGISP